MNQKYIDKCNEAIQKFLKDSTRFEPEEIKVNLIENFDFDYEVCINNKLSVDVETRTIKGRSQPTNALLVFNNKEDFEVALQEELENESRKDEVFAIACDLVENSKYGDLVENKKINTHNIEVAYVYNCPICNGSGSITCGSCGGRGKVSCSSCSGSGRINKTRSVYDSYSKSYRTETYSEYCSSCGGSGKKRCGSCGGSGRVGCHDCNSTGRLTEISSIFTNVIPQYTLMLPYKDVQVYIRESLYKAKLENLGEYGPVSPREINKYSDKREINSIYKLTTSYARFNSIVLDRDIQWICYGIPPRIFDAGLALEILLQKDFLQLKKWSEQKHLTNPFLHIFSRKQLKNFLQSEAHQHMLEGSIEGKDNEEIVESLNRAFSVDYIEQSLRIMTKISKAIAFWSVVKWGIFSGIVSYVVICLFAIKNNTGVLLGKIDDKFYLTYNVLNKKEINYDIIKRLLENKILLVFLTVAIIAFIRYIFSNISNKILEKNYYLKWLKKKKIVKKNMLCFLTIGLIFTCILLYIFPAWINNDKEFMGIKNIEPIINKIDELKKNTDKKSQKIIKERKKNTNKKSNDNQKKNSNTKKIILQKQ